MRKLCMKEYEIYVPLVREDGRRLSRAGFAGLKKKLVERFGGLTVFPQKNTGLWEAGGVVFRDEIVIVRVLSRGGKRDGGFWRALKKDLQIQWKEKEVLIIARTVRPV